MKKKRFKKVFKIKDHSKLQLPMLKKEEYEEMLGNISKNCKYDRNLMILKFLWNTGARVSELCNLKVEDLRREQ